MKNLLSLTLFGACLIQGTGAIAQAVWSEVAVNEVGDRFLVSNDSIQFRGDTAYFWEFRDFPQSNNAFVEEDIDQPIYGATIYRSVDCRSGVTRMRQLLVHDSERAVIEQFNYGDDGSLSQPRAGSSAAAVIQHVCSQRPEPEPESEPTEAG